MGKEIKAIVVGLIIALSVASLITSILSFTTLNETKSKNLVDIGTNWKSGLIKSFDRCNMQTNSRFESYWEGSVEGCYCSYYNELTRGSCSNNNNNSSNRNNTYRNSSCYRIDGLSRRKLNTWKGVDLCSDTTGNYFSLDIVGKNESCPAGMKVCGTIDSVLNKLCVPSSESCPINQVSFTTTKPTTGNFVQGRGFYLKYDNIEGKDDQEILIQMKNSEKSICANLSDVDYVRQLHKLETYYDDRGCNAAVASTTVNPHFFVIDSYFTYDLFSENNVLPVLAQLRNYDFNNLRTTTYLYGRGYVGIRTSCFENFKNTSVFEDLITAGEDSDLASMMALAIMIVNIVVILITSVLFGVTCCMDKDEKCCAVSVSATGAVLKMIAPILLFILLGMVNGLDLSIAHIGNNGCSDAITNETLIHFEESVTESKPYIVTTLAITVIEFLLSIGAVVLSLA